MNTFSLDQIRTATLQAGALADAFPPVTRNTEDGPMQFPADGFKLFVENAAGVIFFHQHTFADQAAADRFLVRVRAALAAGSKLDEAQWEPYRARYGSEAFETLVEPGLVREDRDPGYLLSAFEAA